MTGLVILALVILGMAFSDGQHRQDRREKAREREYERLGLRQGRDWYWKLEKGLSRSIRLNPEGRRRLTDARRRARGKVASVGKE